MAFSYKVYFTERSKHRIVCLDPNSGHCEIIAGEAGNGDLRQKLHQPYGLAVNREHELFVADKLGDRIAKIKNGQIIPVELATDGTSGNLVKHLKGPAGLCVESATGDMLCSYSHSHCICRLKTNGRVELVVGRSPEHRYFFTGFRDNAGAKDVSEFPIRHPAALVAHPNGTIFFAERGYQTLREFHPERGIKSIFGTPASDLQTPRVKFPEEMPFDAFKPKYPIGLALDLQNELYLSDAKWGIVVHIDFAAQVVRRVITSQSEGGPAAIAFAPDGVLWILNNAEGCVQAYTRIGSRWEKLSEKSFSTSVDEVRRISNEGAGIVCA